MKKVTKDLGKHIKKATKLMDIRRKKSENEKSGKNKKRCGCRNM